MAATSQRQIAIGRWGEDRVASHLADAGMEIVDRNWRCPLGELDIVAYDGDTLVLVEVKTRTTDVFGSPVEAVTARKAGRLRRLAVQWLREHQERPAHVRIDVVGVFVPHKGPVQIDHREGVA